MKKFVSLILLTLLLCGCSNTVNEIAWSDGERNGKNVSFIRGEDVKKIYGSEIGGLTWVDDKRFIIETGKDYGNPEERESIFFLLQLEAGELKTILKKKEPYGFEISDADLSGDQFVTSALNGDILRFKNWRFQEKAETGQHELSTIRDVQSGALYYFDGQYMVKKEDGEQAQRIYKLYEDDTPGKEMIYPRALTLSPDKKKLTFAVMDGEVKAIKTIIIDLETGAAKEIQKSMAVPKYFWIGDQFFALANDETQPDTVAQIFYGENFEGTVERVIGNGFCQMNDIKSNYGANEHGAPLVFTYMRADGKGMNEIVLFREDLSMETVYSAADVDISSTSLSPDGVKLLFHEYSYTDDTSSVVVMDL